MDRRAAMNVYLLCVLVGTLGVLGSLWALSAGRTALGMGLRYAAAAILLGGVVLRLLGSRNRPVR